MKNRVIITALLLVCVIVSSLLSGCSGGGGGSSPVVAPPGGVSGLSVDMKMVSRAGTPVKIPSYATGNVVVSVIDKKTGALAASRTVDYQLGSVTFNNEIPTGHYYTVSVKASLHHEPLDTYEVVWSGSSEVLVLSESDMEKYAAASTIPVSLNKAAVNLTYQNIVFVPLFPGKLSISPALPVSGTLSPGSVIPYSTVKVFDQYGNILMTDKFQVKLALANGSFKPDVTTVKTPKAGVASFDGLVISSIAPDYQGRFKLMASCGNAVATSEPMTAAPSLLPNTTMAGYIYDSEQSATASPVSRAASPASNRRVLLVINGTEYSTTTNADGFWKLDVNAGNSASANAVIRYLNAAGIVVKNEVAVTPGKVFVARITVDASGNARVAAFESSVPITSANDPKALEALIDGEVEKMKAEGTGATSISGRVIVEGSDSSIVPANGVGNAQITLMPGNATINTSSDGTFFFNGNFQAGTYTLMSELKDFEKGITGVTITNEDYGFGYSGIKVRLRQKANVLPVVSNLKITGRSKDITVTYDLADENEDLCTVSLYYSIDGGATYNTSNNVSGSISGVSQGQARMIVWSSAKDLEKNYQTVKIKLVANDTKADGAPAESAIFSVSNDPNANLPSIAKLTASGTSEISIIYDLVSPLNEACTVEVYYSTDNGSNYSRTDNVTGDVRDIQPGTDKEITWRSIGDFKTNESGVKVMLVPGSVSGYGQPAESGTFFVANNPDGIMPKIDYMTINGTMENILISYDIAAPDNSPCSVEVFFSTNDGLTYTKTANLTGQTTGVIPGAGKIVIWNSLKDIFTNERFVKIKLVPSNAVVYGLPVESETFTIKNIPNVLPVVSNIRTAGKRRDIVVGYDLADPDSDACTVEVYFSLDGGINYIRSFNLMNDTTETAPLQAITAFSGKDRKLVWRSLDDFATDQPSVMIKLKAGDDYGFGSSAVSLSFPVMNVGTRPAVSNIIAADGTDGVTVKYDLADLEDDSCSVSFAFSLDGGATYRPSLNVSGDTSGVHAGAGRSIAWEYFRDFSGSHDSVTVSLTASDDIGPGAATFSKPFAINSDKRRPAVANLKASGTAEITISYDMTDIDGSKCTVEVYYSTDGANYAKALSVSGDTAEVVAGTGRTILWRATNDIKGTFPNSYIKLVAIDEGGAGKGSIIPYAIANNQQPVISAITVSGSSMNIPVSFTLADNDDDACTIEVYFSKDGGATFAKTTNITNGAAVLSGVRSGAVSFVWNSGTDIQMQNAPTVKLRIVAADRYSAGLPAESQTFAVNNYIPPVIVPVLQSAEFISITKIILKFNTTVDISKGVDTGKMLYQGSPFPQVFDVTLDPKNSSNLIVTNSDGDFSSEQPVGVAGGSPGTGIEFLAGTGILSTTGHEVAPTTQGYAIATDTTVYAPDNTLLMSLYFTNFMYGANFNIVRAADTLNYSEPGHLEVCVSPSDPNTNAPSSIYAESGVNEAYQPDDEIINSSIYTPATGGSVWYRFVDNLNNISRWTLAGPIPLVSTDGTQPFDPNNLAWSNATSSVTIKTRPIGVNSSAINIYDNSNGYIYLTSAYNIDDNAFLAGKSYMTKEITNISGTVYYSYTSYCNPDANTNISNIESNIISGGSIPAPGTLTSALTIDASTGIVTVIPPDMIPIGGPSDVLKIFSGISSGVLDTAKGSHVDLSSGSPFNFTLATRPENSDNVYFTITNSSGNESSKISVGQIPAFDTSAVVVDNAKKIVTIDSNIGGSGDILYVYKTGNSDGTGLVQIASISGLDTTPPITTSVAGTPPSNGDYIFFKLYGSDYGHTSGYFYGGRIPPAPDKTLFGYSAVSSNGNTSVYAQKEITDLTYGLALYSATDAAGTDLTTVMERNSSIGAVSARQTIDSFSGSIGAGNYVMYAHIDPNSKYISSFIEDGTVPAVATINSVLGKLNLTLDMTTPEISVHRITAATDITASDIPGLAEGDKIHLFSSGDGFVITTTSTITAGASNSFPAGLSSPDNSDTILAGNPVKFTYTNSNGNESPMSSSKGTPLSSPFADKSKTAIRYSSDHYGLEVLNTLGSPSTSVIRVYIGSALQSATIPGDSPAGTVSGSLDGFVNTNSGKKIYLSRMDGGIESEPIQHGSVTTLDFGAGASSNFEISPTFTSYGNYLAFRASGNKAITVVEGTWNYDNGYCIFTNPGNAAFSDISRLQIGTDPLNNLVVMALNPPPTQNPPFTAASEFNLTVAGSQSNNFLDPNGHVVLPKESNVLLNFTPLPNLPLAAPGQTAPAR